MSYEITEREYNASLQLNADYREHQFFNKIIKGLDVFVLKNNEDLLMLNMSPEEQDDVVIQLSKYQKDHEPTPKTQTEEGIPTIPLWSHEKFAQYYADHATDANFGKGFEPKAVPLAVFLEKWLPQLKNNGIELAIFPLSNDETWNIISVDEFLEKVEKNSN